MGLAPSPSPKWGTDDWPEESREEDPHVSELESQGVLYFLPCWVL